MEAIGVADEQPEADACCAPSTSSTGWASRAFASCLGRGARTTAAISPRVRKLDPHQIATTLKTLEAEEIGRDYSEETELGREGRMELEQIAGLAAAAGYGPDRIRIDASVVRGLEYYTGAVFEAELLFEIPNEKGQPVVFGSVGGGGRYDGLDRPLRRGRRASDGLLHWRLAAAGGALRARQDRRFGSGSARWSSLVMDKEPERLGDYQRMVRLRFATPVSPAELYLGAAGLQAQMKYADRRNAPVAVIQGADEKAKGVVQIKDLGLGKKLSEQSPTTRHGARSGRAQVEVRGSRFGSTRVSEDGRAATADE